jgi:hypothetical protein
MYNPLARVPSRATSFPLRDFVAGYGRTTLRRPWFIGGTITGRPIGALLAGRGWSKTHPTFFSLGAARVPLSTFTEQNKTGLILV